MYFYETGNFDAAIEDLNHVIELNLQLNSENAVFLTWRGKAKLSIGDLPGAFADFDRAVEASAIPGLRASTNPGLWLTRGDAYFRIHDWKKAIADFTHYCEAIPRYGQGHTRLLIWVARSRLGERPAADRELAEYFNNPPDPEMVKRDGSGSIADFLLEKSSVEQFLPPQSAQPHVSLPFFAGMKSLVDGDKQAAAENFLKVTNGGTLRTVDYVWWAEAELTPVQVSPTNGATISTTYPRKTTFEWQPVATATGYTVDIDFCERGFKDCRSFSHATVIATNYTFNSVGAQPGRWRVRALFNNNQQGIPSSWWVFSYSR
jgi:hypothetical protein